MVPRLAVPAAPAGCLLLLVSWSCAPAPPPASTAQVKAQQSGLRVSSWAEYKVIASDGAYYDWFGNAVSSAGDVNGDGFADIVVGASYDTGRETNRGSAYVYHGSITGIDVTTEQKLTAHERGNEDYFGTAVSGAGDLDGDGYDDLVVGMPFDDDHGTDSGAVYVFYGSSTGIDSARRQEITASDGDDDDVFGDAVSGAGDLDGDGFDDLVVGSPRDDDKGTNSGSIYLYYGTATGIDTLTEHKITASGGAAYDEFGRSVSGAGDVNADGFADLVVGAPYDDDNGGLSGSVFVYYGSSTGIKGSRSDKVVASDGVADAAFGIAVSGTRDLDGDGYDDWVVGASGDPDNGRLSGAVYVYYGSPAGLDSAREDKLTAPDGGSDDHFGDAVSGAGDVDGDGYTDVIVGASGDDDDGSDSGSAYVYHGSPTGMNTTTAIKITASDGASGNAFAWTVSGAGDMDGDGLDDLVVGAPLVDDDGAIYVYGDCRDSDGDGFCTSTDCDDEDGAIGEPMTWYVDLDMDGFGDPDKAWTGCGERPDGYVANAEDCDDDEPLAYPGGTEVCDDVDNDCDGIRDNDDAVDATPWYADADGDGYTSATDSVSACDPPRGYAAESQEADCDDAQESVYPGAPETPGDGIDQDCDGADLAVEDTGTPDPDVEETRCGGCAARAGGSGLPGLLLAGVLGVRRRREHAELGQGVGFGSMPT